MPTKRKASDRSASKRQKLNGTENGQEENKRQPKISDVLRAQRELAEPSPSPNSSPFKNGSSPPRPSSSVENMYSFTSKRDSAGVIDLTCSSPPRPQNGVRKIGTDGIARHNAFAPHQGAVKLQVKNQRLTPRADPEEYFRKEWEKLETALQIILRGDKATLSLGELYRSAENVCRQGRSEDLHNRLRELCKKHVGGTMLEGLSDKVHRVSGTDFLTGFLDAWATWCDRMGTIKLVFSYMDQTYLRTDARRQRLGDMGNRLFKDLILDDHSIKATVLNAIADLIDSERKTQTSDQSSILKRSIPMLHALHTYAEFEKYFFTRSRAFFEEWAAQGVQEDLAMYAAGCQAFALSEMRRCEHYGFLASARSELAFLISRSFIDQHLSFLTDQDSVLTLLEDNNVAALKDVYGLLERVDHQDDLIPIFEEFVRTEGSAIVFDEARESEMVIRLLDFKRKLDRIYTQSFRGYQKLGDGLHKAFEFMMNKTKKSQANWDTDNAKPGEMIAKYVDLLLKGGVRAIPRLSSTNESVAGDDDFDPQDQDGEDAQIDHHLSLALDLFRFVHGKAVFEAFYKKDLARRLLMGRSNSDEAERSMLNRLRTECGANFTRNLENMFKDMELARDEMSSYKQLLRDRGDKSSNTTDLTVSVLSSGSWPSYPDVPCILPPIITTLLTSFEKHYLSKHTGRSVQWKHSLAQCHLRANFPHNIRKELVVSGFQALILLLFNDTSPADAPTTRIPYHTLLSLSNLPEPDLKRTLQSLACGKHRILHKHPRGRDISPTDTFSWNAGFRDPKTHIKINQIQLVETREENRATHVRVAADRHYETQAAVVRIMKARKEVGHAELVGEVIGATMGRGRLEVGEIKKNIDKYVPISCCLWLFCWVLFWISKLTSCAFQVD